MSIQIPKVNEPDMDCAVSIARDLERRERNRGLTVPAARQSLARKVSASAWTIENLVRGRLKRIDAALRDKLRALLIRDLEQEIARLNHDLEIAHRAGAHPASAQIGEVETLLARAAQILKPNGVWGGVDQRTRKPIA